MIDLSSLNPAQRQAVETTHGPLMILAGAGSGKTKTLVTKIGHLLEEHKISPYRILALTFSNKAAKEMRERIGKMIGIESQVLQVTTFHSFCARLLRHEANYIGLTKNFTIYDDSEGKALVKTLLDRRGISPKQINPFEILNYIDQIKNAGFYEGHDKFDSELKSDPYYGYFQEYESELRKSNAIDFGGLITACLELFHRHPEVLKRYQERYEFVLVDEYQDTNRAQFELVLLLSGVKRNICVVGDEDQSIYSWRGADINNILDFESFFSEAKILKLEENYRSSATIIEAATSVIAKNKMRKGKVMFTQNPVGDAIEILETPTDRDEVEKVLEKIQKLVNEGTSLNEIAIFYRANSLSRLLEDSLRRANLQYRIVGGLKFYDRKEIKDALSYMRVIVNPKDSLALTRIINVPTRGLGATTLRKLEDEAVSRNLSILEVVIHLVDNPSDFSHIRISSKVFSALRHIVDLFNECKLMNERGVEPHVVVEKLLIESGYFDLYRTAKDYESMARVENLEELISAISLYETTVSQPSIEGFLESVTLDESQMEAEGEISKGEISLMTIHGAKGLEFQYVFLIGCEENIFPSVKSLEAGEHALEEERRLFYVGMTRAMKKLFITFSQSRMTFGQYHFNGPSRFIYEIPDKFYKWTRITNSNFQANRELSGDYFDQSPVAGYQEKTYAVEKSTPQTTKIQFNHKFPKGSRVSHKLYGIGKVESSEGFGAEEKVTIKFDDGTKKKFMVKFAPLSLL
ncbi:MAG: DNA helicase PcrA [Bdellovibrio sp.]